MSAARPAGRVTTQTAPTKTTAPTTAAPHTATPSTDEAVSAERSDTPPPAAPLEPPYELVDIDRYEVFDDGPVGYVEVIPPLFICYSGHPYPKAFEVAQVFDFEQAVRCVREAARQQQAPHDHRRPAA